MAVHGRRPTRDQLVGEAFAEHAERMQSLVERASNQDHRHLAEDACSIAWQRLAARPDIEIDEDHNWFKWVYVVAIREQWSLARKANREFSLDQPDRPELGPGGTTQLGRIPALEDTFDQVADREQLRLLKELPLPRRRALFLQATGHSYQEIAALSGLTRTQVNRYVSEGRNRVRQLHREQSGVDLPPNKFHGRGAIARPRRLLARELRPPELDL